MPRTEIELTEDQIRRLDEVAETSGRSVADVIRDSVELYLGQEGPIDRAPAKERARSAIGKFRSSVDDLGVNHDRYLEEDFSD